MNISKRIIAALLALVMVFGLAACGGETVQETTAGTEAPTEATAEAGADITPEELGSGTVK